MSYEEACHSTIMGGKVPFVSISPVKLVGTSDFGTPGHFEKDLSCQTAGASPLVIPQKIVSNYLLNFVDFPPLCWSSSG